MRLLSAVAMVFVVAGCAVAQSTNLGSLRPSSQVVTNEQDLVALAAIGVATDALYVATGARDYPRSNPSNFTTSAAVTGIVNVMVPFYSVSTDGAGVGLSANGATSGSAFGGVANGTNEGAAFGGLSKGQNWGAAIGRGANGSFDGVAVGYYSTGTNGGIAIGEGASGSGPGNVAIGGVKTGSGGATVPNTFQNTTEIGVGVAVSNGWFHYRGAPMFQSNLLHSSLLSPVVPTNRTITINGGVGTLDSNLTFTVTGGSGIDANTASNIVRAIAVTNAGATINGNPITNGAAITITGSGGPSYLETTNIAEAAVNGYSNTVTNAVAKALTAWQNPASATNWMWTKTATEVTLTNYNFSSLDVIIPDMLDGLPVTGFGTTFQYDTSITNVSGGANINSVAQLAFSSCAALKSVNLPRVSSIGVGAFYQCDALESVTFPLASSIGSEAYYHCSNLKSATFPLVSSIDQDAFSYCSNLKSVTFPLATNIGGQAFSQCDALESATFPLASIIDFEAFYHCDVLTSVFLGQNAPTEETDVYAFSPSVTNYITNPQATGWGATWNGRPVVRLPLYGDGANLTGITSAQVGAVPTNRTITINGSKGTLDSNLIFAVASSLADSYLVGNFAGTEIITPAAVNCSQFGSGAGSSSVGSDWLAVGLNSGNSSYGDSWVAVGLTAGSSANGDSWGAYGNFAGYEAIHTNSHVFGKFAGRTANGNNRFYIDVYANDPSYAAGGSTNDTIFMDSDGKLFLGGGSARAENPSAGGVLRGAWNVGTPTGSGASLTGITAAQVGAVPTNRTITINGGVGTLDSNLNFTVSASLTPESIGAAGGVTNNQPGVTLTSPLTITSTNGTGVIIAGVGKTGGDDPTAGALVGLFYNAAGNRQLVFGSSEAGQAGLRISGNTFDFVNWTAGTPVDFALGTPDNTVSHLALASIFARPVTMQSHMVVNSNLTVGGSLVVSNGITGNGAGLTNITAAQVGAVPTNRTITINGDTKALDANADFTVLGGDGISAATATQIVQTVNASKTNPVIVTFSQLCTNGPTLLTIPMPYGAVRITKLRVYTLDTNVSVRGRADITEKNSGRCTDLIYFTTNMLFHSMTTTVAGVAGEWTNVVADASGILTGRDNMYTKPFLTPQTWQRATNTTATTIAWACTNMVGEGALVSHASLLPEMTFINRQGETNLYYWHTWVSPRTNRVGIYMELVPL